MKTSILQDNKTKNTKIFQSELTIESPGRINLIGEHTDYNNGHVLPAAIDKKITLNFRKNNQQQTCNIYSENYNSHFQINLKNLKRSNTEWENYILGVVNEIIIRRPDQIKGFDCVIKSELPIGAGISSSAALECGIAKGINLLFDLGLSDIDIIELSRNAEHTYVGTNCGIMDQFAVTKGEKSKIILLNCKTLESKLINANFSPYKIVLLNTNVSHSLSTSAYNDRREECKKALELISKEFHPKLTSLVDIPEEILSTFKDKIPEKLFNRAIYITQENRRVINAVESLKKNDLKEFGKFLYQSHEGLQHLYEVSCTELDFLVDFSRNFDSVIGSRMMGGGFGGCTINLIHQNNIDDYIKRASIAYKKKFSISLTPIIVSISNGVSKK